MVNGFWDDDCHSKKLEMDTESPKKKPRGRPPKGKVWSGDGWVSLR